MTPNPTQPCDTAALVVKFDHDQQARNGVPDATATADREQCHQLLLDVLGEDLTSDGLQCSPLGIGWTDVFEATLRRPVDPGRLRALGWLPLDRVAPGRWAVVERGRVLAGVRLHRGTPSDPVGVVMARCRDRQEVRLREVLELRALQRAGCVLPPSSPVLRGAAEIESGLGGRELAPWATGRTVAAPQPAAGRWGRRDGGRRLVIAISGVDGSGKSTMRAGIAESLDRAGVPVTTVWVRPGMGLGPLAALAAWAKRLLRQDPAPGLRAVSASAETRLPSRRGVLGWIWAMLVSVSFLAGVWRQHREANGVVLYDRHLVDALATLDFAYAGVDLRLPRLLVRYLLPRADVRIYLDVPAEVSVARKPDDVIGESAVRRQLDAYASWLDRLPGSLRLDATRPQAELVTDGLVAIVGGRTG